MPDETAAPPADQRREDEPAVWLGFTAAQLRALCEDYLALDGATSIERGQTPTLDAFIGRCAQEYRALTGIELMRTLHTKSMRTRERRKGGL